MRAASKQRIGRMRLPPAKTLYRMAAWIEVGGVLLAGSCRSSAASTVSRSSSKKAESFIAARNRAAKEIGKGSRLALPFGIKRFCGQLSVGFFQEDFDAAFRLFQLLLAFARQRDALLE